MPGKTLTDTIVVNGQPAAILRLPDGRDPPPRDERPRVDRSKRSASIGKGWAHLQFIAYLEWCEASGEKPLSDRAVARALLPGWAKSEETPKGFRPVTERKALEPFFDPLIGDYTADRKRPARKKVSAGTATLPELLFFRALQPLLGKWRKSFERGERVPEALRVLQPSGRWIRTLSALGRVAVPSYEKRAIEALPRSMIRTRLLAWSEKDPIGEESRASSVGALERVAPGLSHRLSRSGLLGDFQSFAEAAGFGTSPPLGHALTLALDFVAMLPPEGRILFDAIDPKWDGNDWPDLCEYYLCPEWLEARRFSPEGDCDVIEVAMRAQAAEVVALPLSHPRRRLLAAMELRSRAVTEVGADPAHIHHWIALLRR